MEGNLKIKVENFSFYYGNFLALKNINFPIYEKMVTAIIGPSGCGKSTLLRAFNRMHDLYAGTRYEGSIILYPDGLNIVSPGVDPFIFVCALAWSFKSPIPFPKTYLRMWLMD